MCFCGEWVSFGILSVNINFSMLALLKQLLTRLISIQEHVEREVEKFFEYIMNNHHIITEPATTTLLQAFQLSLVIFLSPIYSATNPQPPPPPLPSN